MLVSYQLLNLKYWDKQYVASSCVDVFRNSEILSSCSILNLCTCCCRPTPKKRTANENFVFPKGIWQRFHFDDDHPVRYFHTLKSVWTFDFSPSLYSRGASPKYSGIYTNVLSTTTGTAHALFEGRCYCPYRPGLPTCW